MSLPELWIEKWRPNTVDGYVFKDENLRLTVKSWLANKENKTIPIPNLLLVGKPGSGKTTLAKMLINELNVDRYDILELNGSRENSVDTMRDKVVGFCGTFPNGPYKIVFIDEADYLSLNAQACLRSEIERFSDGVRFILTGNESRKIIPALHSRLQVINFESLDEEQFLQRIMNILIAENVTFDPNDLGAYYSNSYPDLRKCINLLDQHTRNGILTQLDAGSVTGLDYMSKVVDLFKARKFTQGRKMIIDNAEESDYEEIYRYLYKNTHLFGDEQKYQDLAILIIADGIKDHTISADAEINLSATLVKLGQIGKEE